MSVESFGASPKKREIAEEAPPVASAYRHEYAAPESLPGAASPPEEILRRLRALPRAEQRPALEEYKEMIRRQREELAFLYDDVTEIIQRDPDAPYEGLREKVDAVADKIHLDEGSRAITHAVLEDFERRRAAIRRERERFPDDRALFEHLFSAAPKGV